MRFWVTKAVFKSAQQVHRSVQQLTAFPLKLFQQSDYFQTGGLHSSLSDDFTGHYSLTPPVLLKLTVLEYAGKLRRRIAVKPQDCVSLRNCMRKFEILMHF